MARSIVATTNTLVGVAFLFLCIHLHRSERLALYSERMALVYCAGLGNGRLYLGLVSLPFAGLVVALVELGTVHLVGPHSLDRLD